MFDRALDGFGVVERDPACHHLAWNDPAIIGIILMETERLAAWRLPDDIVLADAGAGPATQPCTRFADISPQNDRGDSQIGFPAIADLPRQVLTVAAEPPVPLIGIEAGLERAREHRLETGLRRPDLVGVQRAFDRDEAIAGKIIEMLLSDGDHGASLECRECSNT